MRRFVFIVLALALVASVAPSSARDAGGFTAEQIAAASKVPDVEPGKGFDVRFERSVAPLATAKIAVSALAKRVSDLNVTWNDRFGTVKHVFSDSAFLTAAAPGIVSAAKAERIARDWIVANRGMFGLSAEAARGLHVTRNGALPNGGPHALTFRQSYGDIATFAGGSLGVNLTRDGRIVSAWADTGLTGTLARDARLGASDALARVARAERLDVTPDVFKASGPARADRLTIFHESGLLMRPNARLVAFPMPDGPRLAWRVFFPKDEHEIFSTAVDANTGEYLFRNNQVAHAEGTVYENYPGAPKGGQPKVVSFDGDPAASPKGWVGIPLDDDNVLNVHSTFGNNAFAFTDWGRMKAAPAGLALALIQVNPIPEYAPVSPTDQFNYEYENHWAQGGCAPLNTTGRTVHDPGYVQDRDPAVTNIFYLVNKLHDLSYKYGFTEEFGNFQVHNFGKGGKGMDPVRYSAQAGIANNAMNNANMWTPADGGEPADLIDGANTADNVKDYFPPHGNMYLWSPIPGFEAPCADGDFDASIAYHEYTHGISNRMVGGPDDADALGAAQSGAMGEAWSDWIAMHFLHAQGVETKAVTGMYATGSKITGIRNFAHSSNPLTYGDFGYGIRGPAVHDDGEIWSATLWDLRTALIRKLGVKKGEAAVAHLVFDAMATAPRLPTFLDMRNAILASNKARYRNAFTSMIWSVFARRGMGVSAKARNAEVTTPTPGYDVPGAGNGMFRGTVTDVDGGVLPGARVVIGGLQEGQINPTVVASKTGAFAAKLQPGRYPVTVGGPGYGWQRMGTITIAKGQTLTRSYAISKNLASVGLGAKITTGLAEGDPGLALIDDRESSGQVVTKDKAVVIDLAGSAPATIRSISIAHRPSSNSRLRTPTKWLLEASVDGKAWKRLRAGGAKAAKPRSGINEWRKVVAAAGGVKARFVRITVLETLGGQAEATLGDVQIFGSAPGIKASNAGAEKPFAVEGTVSLANAGGDTASLTLLQWSNVCGGEPPAPLQGLDSYIVEFPDSSGDGVHFFNVDNKGGTSTDLDAYFYAADCHTVTGRAATGAASESGPLPAGTKYVQIVLFAGTTDGFTVRSRTTIEPALKPVASAAKKK